MSKITTIAFDYGGVLGSDSDQWNQYFFKIKDRTGLSETQLQKLFLADWPDLKVGKIRVDVFWQHVAEASEKKVSPLELKKVYDESIFLHQDVYKIAIRLKKRGLRLVILSNASIDWMQAKVMRFHLKDTFEKVYSSASLGVAKPDPKIYKFVLKDLKIKPEQLLFVDNMQSNIDPAKRLGISTIWYTNVAALKEELRNLDLL